MTVGGDLERRSKSKPAVRQAKFMNENRKDGLRQIWKEKGRKTSICTRCKYFAGSLKTLTQSNTQIES